MKKVYGEGSKILGAGSVDYIPKGNQWVHDLTTEINYESGLGKHKQYYDEALQKCFPKTKGMMDEEIKDVIAKEIYMNQKKQEEENAIAIIRAGL